MTEYTMYLVREWGQARRPDLNPRKLLLQKQLSSILLSKIVKIQIKRTIVLKNTPYNLLEIFQHVGIAYYLQLEGSTLQPLKMDAVGSFEMRTLRMEAAGSSGTRPHSVAVQMRLRTIITFTVFFVA